MMQISLVRKFEGRTSGSSGGGPAVDALPPATSSDAQHALFDSTLLLLFSEKEGERRGERIGAAAAADRGLLFIFRIARCSLTIELRCSSQLPRAPSGPVVCPSLLSANGSPSLDSVLSGDMQDGKGMSPLTPIAHFVHSNREK